ncbi:MAG: DUF2490 domain-containing protein [Anaerolineae bacterium]
MIRRCLPLASFLCISIFFFFGLFASSIKRRDFQIWNYNSIQGTLNTRLDLYFETEFRWRDNATLLYYNHVHIELPIHLFPFLDIGPSYRQLWVRNLDTVSSHTWSPQYEPNLNLTFFWHFYKLYFSDRSRVTYRMFPGHLPNVWQYRNKLAIYTDGAKMPLKLRFFIDDEIFIEQKQRGIYENRFSSGINFSFFRKIKADIAYRRQTVRDNNIWHNNDILMLNLNAFF